MKHQGRSAGTRFIRQVFTFIPQRPIMLYEWAANIMYVCYTDSTCLLQAAHCVVILMGFRLDVLEVQNISCSWV